MYYKINIEIEILKLFVCIPTNSSNSILNYWLVITNLVLCLLVWTDTAYIKVRKFYFWVRESIKSIKQLIPGNKFSYRVDKDCRERGTQKKFFFIRYIIRIIANSPPSTCASRCFLFWHINATQISFDCVAMIHFCCHWINMSGSSCCRRCLVGRRKTQVQTPGQTLKRKYKNIFSATSSQQISGKNSNGVFFSAMKMSPSYKVP